MGFSLGGLVDDVVNIGTMGFIDRGGDQDAIDAGVEAQERASNLAIDEQRLAREQGREILDPFVQKGTQGLNRLLDPNRTKVPDAPRHLGGEALGQFGFDMTVRGLGDELQGQTLGQGFGSQLGGEVFDPSGQMGQLNQAVLDPGVLTSNFADDPSFQALQEEATRNIERSAAARGRVGAGGTADAIARQSLLLGNQFQQQGIQNRLQANQQRFGQLQQNVNQGAGLQAQRFNQMSGNIGQQAGLQGQRFGQLTSSIGQRAGLQGQDINSVLGFQGQRFNQLQSAGQTDFANEMARQQQITGQNQFLAGLGQASAAGVGAQGMQAAQNVGGLLTGIGNAQAAGQIAGVNSRNALTGGILGAAGTIVGAA